MNDGASAGNVRRFNRNGPSVWCHKRNGYNVHPQIPKLSKASCRFRLSPIAAGDVVCTTQIPVLFKQSLNNVREEPDS